MRTSFEFKISADTITEAREAATRKVAEFLDLTEELVDDSVNLELKVSYPEAKTLADIAQNMDGSTFVVTVYGSVKQGFSKPFGFSN